MATDPDLPLFPELAEVKITITTEAPVQASREGKISLPPDFLPCVDDWDTLRVIADWLEERGDTETANHCRWTANEWEWGRGMRRANVLVGMAVWARFSSQGWSRALVEKVTPRHIEVVFPHRDIRGWEWEGGMSRRPIYQSAKRAWWDLVVRKPGKKKPKPRKGYGTGKNALLAAALAHNPRET